MTFILHIDTSLEKGSVCLSVDGQLLQLITSTEQKEHASFIQPAINQLLHRENITAKNLSVITVTNGPGSYTGLRVGMATAKGLCYALQIPLITIGTFEIMTLAAIDILKNSNKTIAPSYLFCPMIDARRQEVYTALLNQQLDFIKKPTAEIVSENTLIGQLNACKIYFYGNGSIKFKSVCHHPNAQFINVSFNASNMITLSCQRFAEKKFADLAYSEPFYGKEFYSVIKQ
ncbi:MAG: tRNA (adenosine(37)-N6)-threonylcarbamoyltransferase complex dimerization subunit type 1 TsaB [Sphingobacteriales bacterium]|nr:tRNA (adenosine(37)-N6)-threonylcarbamoyltransferase complex dimerization subunit type 1 TsaB [Sphingobacteriales bacterium]MBI3720588.1 tRNA (adenosine(37)-N6)-threonylcarbamoyltransferase complex dimerization subunit type 1 TsaB [Sphingobacteriales bacterium]